MIQTIQEYFNGMYYHNKKSGYRCSSYYNTSKEFSLIRVIKEKLRVNQALEFQLTNCKKDTIITLALGYPFIINSQQL
jgi:hypothetical protein